MFRHFILFSAIFLFVPVFATAQQPAPTPDEKLVAEATERLRKSIDTMIREGESLTLPENRAVIFTTAGEMLWDIDRERAGTLFRRVGGELMALNEDLKRPRTRLSANERWIFDASQGMLRQTLLPTIANYDPKLAYDTLLSTRTQQITEALQKRSTPSEGIMTPEISIANSLAQQELNLEQNIVNRLADADPEVAIRLFKENLKNGLSAAIFPMLEKIHKHSPKTAQELANDVVAKVKSVDLTNSPGEVNMIITFLRLSQRSTPAKTKGSETFAFTKEQQVEMAEALIDEFLSARPSIILPMMIGNAIPTLEKIVPARIPQVREKMKQSQSGLPREFGSFSMLGEMDSQDTTPEQIVNRLPTMPEQNRNYAYELLKRRIPAMADEDEARKLTARIPDEKVRREIEQQLESKGLERDAAKGELENALNRLSKIENASSRLRKTVDLAIAFHRKDTEEYKEFSQKLMDNAETIAYAYSEDRDELADQMEIIRGYSVVDPEKAFNLFGPVVDQMNEVVQAYAVLSKYERRDSTFRNGELVTRPRGGANERMIVFRFPRHIEMLGRADTNRMGTQLERIYRPDIRVVIRLYSLKGEMTNLKVMKGEKVPDDIFSPETGAGTGAAPVIMSFQ
ncbi:MAG: hypothetical protein KF685_03855 [Acidobacteria bacterium]|nr:hypothetical protein [Acidobacteriota bacterium]